MRLYATAQSERAKEEQGGNDFITATITLDREVIATVQVSKRGIGGYFMQARLLGEHVQERRYCQDCARWYANDEVDRCDIPF